MQHPSMVDTQPLPRFRASERSDDSDSAISLPAVRMGDESPPPCPDWFAWWLKHEYRPEMKAIRRQLTAKKVAMEVGKPILYSGITLLATQFPWLKQLVGGLVP